MEDGAAVLRVTNVRLRFQEQITVLRITDHTLQWGPRMSGKLNHPQQDFESELANILTLRLCHRAILKGIGQELEKLYKPPHDVPHQLLTLLVQFDENTKARSLL